MNVRESQLFFLAHPTRNKQRKKGCPATLHPAASHRRHSLVSCNSRRRIIFNTARCSYTFIQLSFRECHCPVFVEASIMTCTSLPSCRDCGTPASAADVIPSHRGYFTPQYTCARIASKDCAWHCIAFRRHLSHRSLYRNKLLLYTTTL